ncbi:MAG: AAA family ATPase [Chloroflexi bacterium]|nr:AAA family ATPase [Chloroflexota bacterium]
MAMLIQRDRNAARKVFGDVLSNTGQSRAVVDVVRNGTTESVVLENGIFKDTVGRLPLLAIPDSRFINRANQTLAATAAGTEPLYRSGASNFLNQEPYDGVIQDLLAQLAADYFTTNQRLDLPLVQLVERVVQQLTEDRTFKFAAIERSGRVGYRILVRTEIHPSTPLPIQAASQGTLSVVSIFGLIYSFLDSNWPNTPESEITSRPGVVIIDELDAHLHPSWQRKIMGLLTRTFPNVQFIVSAHSPLVVGGCDWGEVAVLRRPEPGRGFRLERIEHDFIGAQSADVYRQIFEVDDASDRLYLQYTATLDPGADVEREIQRLERKRFLSDEDKQQLNDLRANLQDTKRLAKRAAEAREERLNTESTDARIRQLEGEVRRLQSQLKLRAAELAARHPEDAVNELSTSDSTVEDRSR